MLRCYRPERVIACQGATHVRSVFADEYLVNVLGVEKKVLLEASRKLEQPQYPAYDKVLGAVRRAGGVVFLAHPALYMNEDSKRLDSLRELLAFDGIECAHPLISASGTGFYRAYCKKHNLLSSAGSDTHSVPDSEFNFEKKCVFGGHFGEKYWLDELLERVELHAGPSQ